MDISDLKLDFSIEDGSDLALGGGKLLFPSPTSGMKRKLLWKWIPGKHSLAQFHGIKGKRMSPLATGVNPGISNCIWPVSHCCLKDNWMQTPLFFEAASQTPLWISKDTSLKATHYPAYRIIIWDLFSRDGDLWRTRHKTGIPWTLWPVGNRRQKEITGSCSICSSHGLVRGPFFCVVCLWMSCMTVWLVVSLHEAVAAPHPLPCKGFLPFSISLPFPPTLTLLDLHLPKSIGT